MSVNAELTHPVDKAGPTAGPGATVETGKLNRSLEMGKSGAPHSAATVPGGSENGLLKVAASPDGYVVGIRAVLLGDGKLLRQMFSRLSKESIYRRFHLPYPSVPEWAVALFTGVDETQGKYLVAVAGNSREPTSGLEPLTCSLRVSCSITEGVVRATPPFFRLWPILIARRRSRSAERGT